MLIVTSAIASNVGYTMAIKEVEDGSQCSIPPPRSIPPPPAWHCAYIIYLCIFTCQHVVNYEDEIAEVIKMGWVCNLMRVKVRNPNCMLLCLDQCINCLLASNVLGSPHNVTHLFLNRVVGQVKVPVGQVNFRSSLPHATSNVLEPMLPPGDIIAYKVKIKNNDFQISNQTTLNGECAQSRY